MKPLVAVILSLIAGAIGVSIGILCADIGGGMISCVVIAMGSCIIHTINKNYERLRADILEAEHSKKEND